MKNDRIPAVIYFAAAVLWAVAAARCFVIGRAAAGVMWIAACAGSIGAGVFMLRRASLNKKPAYIKIAGAGGDDAFGEMTDELLRPTQMLDINAPAIRTLIDERGWQSLEGSEKTDAIYRFVADEISFGFNADSSTASSVIEDGFGQSNSKATLFMALLRSCGVACKVHGWLVDKSVYADIMPVAVYKTAPQNLIYFKAVVASDNTGYEFTPAGKDPSLVLRTKDLGEYNSPDELLAENVKSNSVRAAAYNLAGRRIANLSIKKSAEKEEDENDEND